MGEESEILYSGDTVDFDSIKREKIPTPEEIVEELTEPTAENAIKSMIMSELFHLTADGKLFSHTANEYLAKMSEYACYCKEETREVWLQKIIGLMNLAYQEEEIRPFKQSQSPESNKSAELNNYLGELHAMEDAVVVMKALANDSSWEQIIEIVRKQGYTKHNISDIGEVMAYFSPYGFDFVGEVVCNSFLEIGKKRKRSKNKK